MKTVLSVLFILMPFWVTAQRFNISPQDTERKNSYVLTRDGLVVRGQVLRQDSSLITVRKRNGDLSFIEADQVIRITPNRPDQLNTAFPGRTSAPLTVYVLKDNVRLEGKFVRRDSTMITVRKSNGQLTYFEPELLVRVDTVQGTEASGSAGLAGDAIPNRFSPWLLTGQTAYNPEKGRLYYRNTLLLLNEFQYGLTRNLSVGVNINPFFGHLKVNNANEQVFGATIRLLSKLTFPIGEQFRFGINAIYQPRQNQSFFGVARQITLQGLMSFGTSQRNATLGYSLQIRPDYSFNNKTGFITAGVMHKISRSLTILSDNTFYLNPYHSNSFFGGSSAELSIALRIDRHKHAFDLGVVSAVQPRLIIDPGFGPYNPGTKAYFYPYLAYNLLIGRN